MKILVLDDSKNRQDFFSRSLIGNEKVIQAYNYDQAVKALEEDIFDLIFLDHDLDLELDTEDKTGLDVAKYIADMPYERFPKECIVHSLNSYGADNIVAVLEQSDIKVKKLSYLQYYELNK
jgi:CheY-like chemotaxis protein